MEILDKVSNIIKNKLANLYMVKNIKRLKKAHTHTHTHTHTHKRRLLMFICTNNIDWFDTYTHTHTHTHKRRLLTPIILIDSNYRKDKNYYSKIFLEKYYFIKDRKFL